MVTLLGELSFAVTHIHPSHSNQIQLPIAVSSASSLLQAIFSRLQSYCEATLVIIKQHGSGRADTVNDVDASLLMSPGKANPVAGSSECTASAIESSIAVRQ